MKKLVSIMLIGITMVMTLTACGKSGKSSSSEVKSGAEGALDSYFAALSNFDLNEFYGCCYPDDSKKDSFFNVPVSAFYQDYTKSMLQKADPIKMDQKFYAHYLTYYGYSCRDYNNVEEASETNRAYFDDTQKLAKRFDDVSKSDIKKVYPDFTVTYELNNIVDASECTFYKHNEADFEQTDINTYLSEKVGYEPSEVKFANITVEWKYGDKLYGYDEDWWNQSDFKDIFSTYNLEIKDSYDTAIEISKKNATVDVILYKYDDKWYIYSPYILKSNLKYKVEY